MMIGCFVGPCRVPESNPVVDWVALAMLCTLRLVGTILWSWIWWSSIDGAHDTLVAAEMVGDRKVTISRRFPVGLAVEPAMLLLVPIG